MWSVTGCSLHFICWFVRFLFHLQKIILKYVKSAKRNNLITKNTRNLFIREKWLKPLVFAAGEESIRFFLSLHLFFLLELETDWKRMLKLVCIVLRRHQINVDRRRRSSPASLDVLIFFPCLFSFCFGVCALFYVSFRYTSIFKEIPNYNE